MIPAMRAVARTSPLGTFPALIARSVFYELVERAGECDKGTLGVRSGGLWFPLGDEAKQSP